MIIEEQRNRHVSGVARRSQKDEDAANILLLTYTMMRYVSVSPDTYLFTY